MLPSTRLPTLHLYRHLLREASYLPPACTPWVRSQIKLRFKKHQKPKSNTPPGLITHRIRLAHTKLRTLRAANAGQLLIMTKIIEMVYGRAGRRRRLLISDFLHSSSNSTTDTATADLPPPSPSASPSTDPVQAQYMHKKQTKNPQLARQSTAPIPPPLPNRPDWLETWNIPALHALAASQVSHPFHQTAPPLKASHARPPTEEHVPATNIWGKPLTPRLARHKMRKWYRGVVARVMAPVPREEWEGLGELARGVGERWKMPERRVKARPVVPVEEKLAWDWRVYAEHPVRSLERGQSRSERIKSGQEGSAPYGLHKPTKLVRYDRKRRMWRRLYMRVWEATPTMVEKEKVVGQALEKEMEHEQEMEHEREEGGNAKAKSNKNGDVVEMKGREYKVLWGGQKKKVQKPRSEQMAFFENIPEHMLPKKSKLRMRKKHSHSQYED